MRYSRAFLRVLVFVAAAMPVSAAIPAQAADATITVTTEADPGTASDGFCSLREAIANANGDNQSGSTECAAGVGDDLITIPAGYTITLASALPNLGTPMTIQGGGAGSTVIEATACDPVAGACAHEFRVLTVTGAPVTVESVTIRHGRCTVSCGVYGFLGGGIFVSGSLTLSSATLTANQALRGGGLMANGGGSATIRTSRIYGNNGVNFGGGAMADNGSTLNILSGTVIGGDAPSAGNQAANGGGIMSSTSAVTIQDSAITGNVATLRGGAIYDQLGSVKVLGSRIVSNTAGVAAGGVYLQLGGANTIDIQWSCVVGNNNVSLANDQPDQQIARHVWWGISAGANQPGGDTTSGSWDASMPLASPPVEGCANVPAPAPSKPANGAAALKTPSLSWKKYAGAFQYQVQVDDDADYASPEVVKSTRSTVLKLPALGYGLYHWRVRADLGWGITTMWNQSRTFAVTLLKLPRANGSTRDTTPSFSWYADKTGGATQYTLCYDADPSPLDGTCEPVTGLKFTPGAPLPSGDVYWTITIVNGTNAGLTLPVQKFTISN